MGTSRIPLTLTIGAAATRGVHALQIHCWCGRKRRLPIPLAYWLFGPDQALERLERRLRCTQCGKRPFSIERDWRRRGRSRWWEARPRLGPCD